MAYLKGGIRDFSVKGRGVRFGIAILIEVRFYDAEIGKCLFKVSQFAHSWCSEDEGVLILCETNKKTDKNSSSGLRVETGIRGNISGKCINKTIKKEQDAKEHKYFVFV